MKKYYFSLLAVCLLTLMVLIFSWTIPGFSDWYVENVFPVFTSGYGYLTGKLSFSLGEIMLYGACIYLALSILLYLIRLLFKLFKSTKLKKFARINTRIICLLLTIILLVQVNNCFVMYHTSKLFDSCALDNYKPTKDDLVALQNSLAAMANKLYTEFERNDKGEIINQDNQQQKAIVAMQNLSKLAKERVSENGINLEFYKRLSRLSGSYSKPKPLKTSKFFSQQGILGYYFPFSLEANYNQMMYIVNYPSTLCHELSHLKGFIREDEANFISYLACMNSEDSFMQYSAILNLLSYCYAEMNDDPSLKGKFGGIYPRVYKDMVFLTEDAWEKVEESAVISTETVSKASNEFLDANLTLNGVEEGIASYNGVIELALKFYFGER